jgi:formylglycine-generating enzyme required for sulfatase activity
MKAKLIAAIMGLAAFASSASVTISDVIVRQQWPWNGKVNIDYVLSDPSGGEHDINVVLRNADQVITNEYGSLTGDLFGVKSGAHRIVWDPQFNSPAYADKVMADFSVTLSTDDDAAAYMVIDLSGGAGAAQFPVTFTNRPPADGWNQDVYKTTKLVLRHIPAGSFRMGSPDDEIGHSTSREKLHTVTFTNDFYIGVFEMSYAQYSNIVHTVEEYSAGAAGSKTALGYVTTGMLRGAGTVSDKKNYYAIETDSFFGRFNGKFSFTGKYAGYAFDLPTMSQWEYACRAGTTGAWNDGTTITDSTTDAQLGRIAWYRQNASLVPKGIGTKSVANNFGLYDMHGNVAELCVDKPKGGSGAIWWTEESLVEPLCQTDNWSWNNVNRGGNVQINASGCRSASTSSNNDANGAKDLGFRMAFIYNRFANP